MIDGEPLGDEYLMVLETTGAESVSGTVAVHAPRGSFRVMAGTGGRSPPREGARRSANQDAVVNALFHAQWRERDDHDRAVLARVPFGPRSGACL
jgi:hypothetical protein